MKDKEELEMLLDEIPHATSLSLHHQLHQHNHHVYVQGSNPSQKIHGMYENDPLCYRKYMCISPASGVSLRSEGSSSSSLSGGFSTSDDGSPTPPQFEESKPQTPSGINHYPNELWLDSKLPDSPVGKHAKVKLMDELGLAGNLRRMNIRDGEEEFSIGPFQLDPYRIQFYDNSPVWTNHINVEKNGSFDDRRKEFLDYVGVQRSAGTSPMSFDDEMRSALLRYRQECQMGNLTGSSLIPSQSDAPFSEPSRRTDPMIFPSWQVEEYANNETLRNLQLRADSDDSRHCNSWGTRVPNVASSIAKPCITDAFLYSQGNGMDSNGGRGVLNSLSSQFTDPKLPFGAENPPGYTFPLFNGRAGTPPNSWVTQSPPSVRSNQNFKASNCEDSLIIQGKGLNYVISKEGDCSRGHKNFFCNEIDIRYPWVKSSELDGQSHFGGIPALNCENNRNSSTYCPLLLPPKYNSLAEVQGYIYFIAKHQYGCRFLQRKFDEGTAEDVQMIFKEIIHHMVELMTDPFGNYLIQKLLDVCTEDQRMHILLTVTEEPGKLVKISLNSYGTRVVQKLIETLKTRQQILMVVSALEPGFLDLIKDLNGNHVVQRCLQCLSNEYNKFIFFAAAKFCVNIATHRHGCCVLQRCIAHSTGAHREKLVAEISTNGLLLSQDAFGNYVVQFILELKIPSATANLISQFKGNYVHLSTQKFSSNVVEKCLKIFDEDSRSTIIHELLSTSRFEQLLQDPFANYVIQSALGVTKGPLRASLVEAIRSHSAISRTSPYCKRIFSRTLLKK